MGIKQNLNDMKALSKSSKLNFLCSSKANTNTQNLTPVENFVANENFIR